MCAAQNINSGAISFKRSEFFISEIEMSDKNLEEVFRNHKTEFNDLHTKIEGIINKYEVLEKQLESKKNGPFRCRKCKMKFESLKELQKHKKDKKCCVDDFKCKQCFKSETDLDTHKITHGNFVCGQCDCKYDIEGQLDKHVSAVHGKNKIFCHYHNNEKDCP